MSHEEYGRDINRIRNEVETGMAAFYTADEINQFGLDGPEKLEKLNRDAGFWKLQVYSLQTTYFVTLGRLFDNRSDVYSMKTLCDETEAHPEYFAKTALADRKRKIPNGQEPEWLKGYLEHTWEPSADELKAFRAALEPARTKYQSTYSAIRHKFFAHSERDAALANRLLANTLVADIEEMFYGLNEVVLALHALYDNGAKHEVGTGTRAYIERVRARTRAMLDRL
jgi:hypothetical protein